MYRLSIKKLFLRLSCVLVVPLTIALGNYFVDLGHHFDRGKHEQAIARMLLQGSNVTGVLGFDDRLLNKYCIEGSASAHQVVVFGSSRMWPVRQEWFPGRTFFNYSVRGATIEDDVAIYQMLRQGNLRPQHLVLGLDPWLLNAKDLDPRWMRVTEEYIQAANSMGLQPRSVGWLRLREVSEKAEALFSLPLFRKAVGLVWKRARARMAGRPSPSAPIPTKGEDEPENVLRADGSLAWGRSARTRSVAAVRADALMYASRASIEYVGGFSRLGASQVLWIEAFLDWLKRDGVEVTLVLPPFHPALYATFCRNREYRHILDAEDYFRRIAAARGLRLLGSYDPARCGLRESDFLDGIHPRETGLVRLFRDVVQRDSPSVSSPSGPGPGASGDRFSPTQ